MEYYVYLLECSDGLFYIGVTNDLGRRVLEHQGGENPNCFTYERRPVILKYYMVFDYIDEAINYEKKLKKYSRAKKIALFKKDWVTMHKKAKCKNASSHENNPNDRSSGDETWVLINSPCHAERSRGTISSLLVNQK